MVRRVLGRGAMGQVGLVLFALVALIGCGQPAVADGIVVEALPEVQPQLPTVPTIPPPPHPVTLPDGSYTVYGARRRIGTTIDTEIAVTGYIVDIYQSPCPPDADRSCVAVAPHFYIADTPGEADPAKRMMVAGYAENEASLCEAIEAARRGRPQQPTQVEPGVEAPPPIPTDLAVGAKIKVQGRFTRISGMGFNVSDGMLDWRSHTILEPAPEGAVTSCNRLNEARAQARRGPR
ncbi:MAG: hypothetical protein NZ898_12410 [Myxococcota bacterium]|nr:hypothetical protein [Myxococcota bacterium]MDW8361378.1 hypothetical protein [Myxococcales bacterium]